MKKLKLISLAFLCIALIFGVASAATLSINPADTDLAMGEKALLAVNVADVQGLGSFDIDVTWDSSIVSLSDGTDVIAGPSIDNLQSNVQRGRVRLAGLNSTLEGISGSETLCYLNFTGVGDNGQTSDVNIKVNRYGFLNSTFGKDIPVDQINQGKITARVSNTIDARIGVAGREVPDDKETTIKATVANQRNYETSKLNVNVTFTKDSAEVKKETYSDVVIAPGGKFIRDIAWTPGAEGLYLVNITVTSEDAVKGRPSDEKSINAIDYQLDIIGDHAYGYSSARVDNWFYFYFRVEANKAGNVILNVNAPEGFEIYGGENQTKYLYNSNYNYVYVHMRTSNPGNYAGDDFTFNMSANGKSDSIKGRDIRIYVPSMEVNSIGTEVVSDGSSADFIFNTLHTNNTNRNSTVIVAQLGAQGRTLSGLGYLVGYPYGCVEQTTSKMMASLNVKNYYLGRDDPPDDFDRIRNRANESVERGINVLVNGKLRGQHDDGGWSLWGYGSSEASSSSYASYTLAKINRTDEDLRHLLNGKISSGGTVQPNTVNFDMLIKWFNKNHKTESGTMYWEWEAPVCHSWTSQSNTPFVMLIHSMINETCEVKGEYKDYMLRNMENATKYVVNNINTGRISGDDKNMATALSLWGLEAFGITSADVSQEALDTAKTTAREYLIEAQSKEDGSWSTGSKYGWSNTGRITESTAYAILALNATGITGDNTTITDGINWLVNQYENGGKWGYTWASQAAIDALITCQGSVKTSGTVSVDIDSGSIVKNVALSDAAGTQRVEVTLTEDEMKTLMSGGTRTRGITGNPFGEVRYHTVDVTLTGDGPVIVSVENTQWAPLNEIDNLIRNSQTIQDLDAGETVHFTMFNRNIDDSAEIDDISNFTLAYSSSPDPLVVGKEGEITVGVTSDVDLFSPMIEVPIAGFVFDNTSGINDKSISFEVLNSTANAEQDSIFIQPEQWVADTPYSYSFKVTPDDYGTLNMSFRIIPLYDDEKVAIAGHNFDVTGNGSVTINVQNENYNAVKADNITVDGVKVFDTSSYTFSDLPIGNFSLSVKKADYPEVHGTVGITYNKTSIYNVTMPTSMDEPVLIFSEGDSGSIAGSSHTPGVLSAMKKENMTYNVSVMGEGGRLAIALKFPMRYLMTDPVVKLNGVVLGADEYELTRGTFVYDKDSGTYSTTDSTLVIYNSPSGTNYIELEFEGGIWGDADNSGEVDLFDALDILDFYLGNIEGFDTYDYPNVDDLNSDTIDLFDALKVLDRYLGNVNEFYN
ncbi:cellulosome anchoring protein cohesin region [Methanoplanus limicola]|uniref:Cellulosome anchoring protein cohesin region n=1 Tax=Methanoplanus limicola DSM 2279 TaxID=937775 RepID=H1YZT0_9EURY|nr:cellulosome anchoring protein cohesin region [Methanoplanus limicola]EHQ34342.1 cellulosome anchoring protein cohesin region [Methanoplanus limicola DSM 2279]